MKDQRILIVEDEIIISENHVESLRRLGYTNIQSAHSAYEALEVLNENDFDVVLMDVKLNDDIDGIDVIEKIKQNKDVQVIYLTGNSDDYTVAKAKKTLPSGFITKPITENNLKIQLELLLYRESVLNPNTNNHASAFSPFEGNLNGLTMSLYFDGTILAVSPQIKKLTGIPSYRYSGVNISKAVFNNDFFHMLCEILDETLISDKRTFYGKTFSPYIGERMLSAEATFMPGQLVEIVFTDLSKKVNERSNPSNKLSLAVASRSHEILKIVAGLNTLVPYITISALLPDEDSVKNFVSTDREGILMYDINFIESAEIVEKLSAAKNLKKVIMASPIDEHELLQDLDLESYDACISKGASDSTVIEMLHQVQKDYKYFDRSLINVIS